MEYFVFDTECTGVADTDEVIQLSGIRLDENLKIKGLVNWYCNTTIPINPEATNVHGITDGELARLSGGNFLEDYLNKPENNWLTNPQDLTFVAYNCRFDKRKVNYSLTSNGYHRLNFGRTVKTVPNNNMHGVYNVCLMEASTGVFNYKYGNKKLCEVVNTQTKYTNTEIELMLEELCTTFKVRHIGKRYHDALYDSLALTLLLHSNRMYFMSK